MNPPLFFFFFFSKAFTTKLAYSPAPSSNGRGERVGRGIWGNCRRAKLKTGVAGGVVEQLRVFRLFGSEISVSPLPSKPFHGGIKGTSHRDDAEIFLSRLRSKKENQPPLSLARLESQTQLFTNKHHGGTPPSPLRVHPCSQAPPPLFFRVQRSDQRS